MAETWLRVSTEPENRFPALSEWQEDVSMLVTAGSKNEVIGIVTKLWSKATPAQVTQWHIFKIATFLMGTIGKARDIGDVSSPLRRRLHQLAN